LQGGVAGGFAKSGGDLRLESANRDADVKRQRFTNAQNAVDMVGHYAKRGGGDLGVIGGNASPAFFHDAPRIGEVDAVFGTGAEKRASRFRDHGEHIKKWRTVIVVEAPAVLVVVFLRKPNTPPINKRNSTCVGRAGINRGGHRRNRMVARGK
jgi:hypothetical protein